MDSEPQPAAPEISSNDSPLTPSSPQEARSPRDGALPRVSPWLVRAFTAYARRYLQRHFHSVRVLQVGQPFSPASHCPLIVFLNHPSWWDPLVSILLTFHCFPHRTPYAPIEAAALAQYRFFARLGFFGVEPGTRRGAAAFLRTSQVIVRQPNTVLWITPAGQFTDPRLRPVQLRPGLGSLASRLHDGVLLPLALEYPFWEERTPEALAGFGEPVFVKREHGRSAAEWTALLSQRLEHTQDVLAIAAQQRNHEAFVPLLGGAAGVGGIYDLWRSFRARLHGKQFQREHGAAKR